MFATPSTPDFDLSEVMAQVERAHPGEYSREDLDQMEAEYRRYLLLCRLYSGVCPSPEIDVVWHQHILNTEKYFEDCQKYFGHYLHHRPDSSDQFANAEFGNDREERTAQLYAEQFGERPQWFASAATCDNPSRGSTCDNPSRRSTCENPS